MLFTFPSRYWCAIGHQQVFSLGGWSPRIPTGCHVSRGTWVPRLGSPHGLSYRTFTFCGEPFQTLRLPGGLFTPPPHRDEAQRSPATPTPQRARAITWCRFGLFPFRSPLLRESRLLSFPWGTEMFQFPQFAFARLWIRPATIPHDRDRVAPFGNPRIDVCVRLPGAYRSLPRPSSPADAKASTVHS